MSKFTKQNDFSIPKELDNNSAIINEDSKNGSRQNLLSPMMMYPHASPFIFPNQRSPNISEYPIFRPLSGMSPLPLPIDKIMNPQLSWNLSDNNKQDSDKEKLLPQFDGELKEESCCDDNSDRSIKDDQVENRMFTMAALSPGFNQDLRYNNLLSPYMNAEDKVGIIKPKAMHIILQNPLSTPKISTNDEIREESKPINPMKKISEKEEYKTQDELYDSSKYEMINSIFPNGGQIKVMKIHLNRILKLRKIKRKCSDDNVVITPAVRIRSNEPIYDSRSKFATKRIRDKNGRFFTKEGYEEYLKRLYIDSVLSYISSHNFPGIDAQELRYKSYDEILAIFPERVFRIEHLKTRKTNR